MIVEVPDRRIALAVTTAGYSVAESGFVEAPQGRLKVTEVRALNREITKLAERFPIVFLDLLGATDLSLTAAEILAKKWYSLERSGLILLDPDPAMMKTFDLASRQNGLAYFAPLYTTNPNPTVRIKA